MALRMYAPESSSELPTSWSACSSDQVPPSWSISSYSAAIQSGSVSASVPSKSHSAAARVEVVVSLMARPFFLTPPGMREPAQSPTVQPELSRVEVLRLRMMHDQRVSGLLGMQLQFLGQLNADPLWVEQRHQLAPVAQLGAGRIAEGVSGASVGLVADHLLHRPVVAGKSEIRPDPGMPHLGQCLGQLHTQPMQLEIVPVRVLLEQAGSHLRNLRPHGDQVEC